MASSVRTLDFLPEIFQTDINNQFLSATLDQLVQEPKLKSTQGYIGRKVGPGVDPNDNYVLESSNVRNNYQLEPGFVFQNPNTSTANGAITYPGIINSLELEGANIVRYDRLFNSEYYAWDPLIDFDKFVNFGQYYWLPSGPNSVDVSATDIPLSNDFTVTRSVNGYTFSGYADNLPTIFLARQGNYTFDVNQAGNAFWIQAAPGIDGTMPFNSQSSREVFGVSNNGEDLGSVTFNVPSASAQDFYYNLTDAGSVDFVTDLQLDDINGVRLSTILTTYGGIDGIRDLQSRTVIFTETLDGLDGGWTLDGSTEITDAALKYAVWRLNFSDDVDPVVTLSVVRAVDNLSKLAINYGNTQGGSTWYKTAEGYYERQPLLTANLDVLYYQDQTDASKFGVIKLVDVPTDAYIDINDILSSSSYTSPNGVVFSNGLKVQFEGNTVPASYSGKEYYVEGVGETITLHPVSDFVTPESYTQSSTVPFDSDAFDSLGFDDSLNAPTVQDYITINRASRDLNAWTRSNRWFHVDIINASAEYNNTIPVLDNNARAKRPIIEFESNLKLFDFGTDSIAPVNIIDFTETDAFSNINGTIGYNVDGYALQQGSKVIFANDLDPEVRNKVYLVDFVQFDDSSQQVIDLQPADINSPDVVAGQSVLITSGITSQGKTYYFDGNNWVLAQQKTSTNQAPLFDVFDENGYSFGDTTIYSSSDFEGSKLFSYARGSGVTDSVIGQPLQYLSINNVGDIVFDNNLYVDTFSYVSSNTSVTKDVSDGVVRKYSSISTWTDKLGWETASSVTTSRQIFSFVYNSLPLKLDVPVDITVTGTAPIKIFVDDEFVLPSTYSYSVNGNETTITFTTAPAVGAKIEVSVISKVASSVGYYSIPTNLENNSVNANSDSFTLGTIRRHHNSICQNIPNFTGKVNGANNLRDLNNPPSYGEQILQHSSPLSFASTFLYQNQYNYFDAVSYSSYEYEKYKNLILNAVAKNDWSGQLTSSILDTVIEDINTGKNQTSPFYWTDTLPTGQTYDETVYTFSNISTNTFDTLYSYDFTSANYQGILVYLNDEILAGDGHDYTVASDGPRIIINSDKITLAIGDKIKIREYTETYGNFVPATPASLGLDKPYEPEKYTDNTYVTPTEVIRGHDGSITVGFGDIRDDVLLEFETRIYSNIKTTNKYNPPMTTEDVVPGQFRTTDYSLAEINELLSADFLRWVGTNKLNYTAQDYDANNKFTWNYSRSQNKLDNSVLLGGWRAIYFDLYDTDSPHTRPWEMLGLTERPDWWNDVYGPAPYTSGNLVLWRDLRDGKLADPVNGTTVFEDFKRPQLLEIIPSDSEGNLLAPFDVVVGNYDQNSFRKSWAFGDQGPTETAWRRSSTYRFSLQKLFALTQPAKYFALNADRDKYVYNTDFAQYLYNDRYRIQTSTVELIGQNATSAKHSYINFIIDWQSTRGTSSSSDLQQILRSINVQLCYRLGSFSDKRYLKIFSEKSSPNSLNSSLLLPDESYQLVLYKNPQFARLEWSSVLIQKTSGGYTVFGYSTANPYFTISKSLPSGAFDTINVNGQTARIARDFSGTTVRIPYGYEFTNINAVIDFIISYGNYIESQGMKFNAVENNTALTWLQMAKEFLYWSTQGWQQGTIINLNPVADLLELEKQESVVDNLALTAVLDQNGNQLTPRDYGVVRDSNKLKLIAQNNKTFSLLDARFTSYEHVIIFDNTSIFNDLLYDPTTGQRQSRLLLNGYKTYDWNGTLNAQGFILNEDNVKEWQANQYYSKGQIVLFKDSYWSASTRIPPKQTFDYNDWIKSDYENISKGLLPNLATNSELMRNFYDNKVANLERDADLLAFGLTGFRPRQYMQNLNLSDISQVNLYQQFLGTKGTIQAAELFTQANLDKEVAEYDIFENWAINRATYGANGNRRYFELRLDESKLLANPASVSVVAPEEVNTADQQILIKDIYKESYNIQSTDILPTIELNQPDVALPGAGYVNFDDVDIKVFDLDDLQPILNNLDEILVGTSIWVAKDTDYNWNVYRNNLVVVELTQIRDNLNGTCTLTFNGNHGLSADQIILIKYFLPVVDGPYKVNSVPTLKTITIALSLPDTTTTLTSSGVVFVLESVRLSQASDVSTLGFANNLLPGNRAWVDDDGTGHWAVYEKNSPYTQGNSVDASTAVLDNQFGSSIAQGLLNQGLLIGAPGYASGVGGLYAYNRADNNFSEKTIFSPLTTGTANFGNAVDAGSSNYAVAGANLSDSSRGYAFVINREESNGSYFITQCLVESELSSGSQFGYDVAISRDERWMAVSAPNDDTVHVYNKVTVQDQSLTFIGDGITRQYDISDTIKIDDDSSDAGIGSQQLNVTINGIPQLVGVDWVYQNGQVAFTSSPSTGNEIFIERIKTKNYYPATATTVFSVEDVYTIENIYSFSVLVNDVIQRPFVDYTYNNTTKEITFISGGVSGNVVITSNTHWRRIDTLTYTDNDSATLSSFGISIDMTTDGRQIIIGSPYVAAGNEIPGAGKTYVFDRSVERFQVSDADTRTYNTLRTPNGPVTIKINNTFLQPTGFNNNGQFTVVGNAVTINSDVTLAVGDIIEIETNTFNVMQVIESNVIEQDTYFGKALAQCNTNCSLYIGKPNDNTLSVQSGAVERWINQNRLFGIITSNTVTSILNPGDSIRINNYDVLVTNPNSWSVSLAYTTGSFVRSGDSIYVSIQSVPAGTSLTDTTYWRLSNWTESYANDINTANIPNVVASYADNKITLSLESVTAGDQFIKLIVLPGIGNAWNALGFTPIAYAQTILPPLSTDYAQFGEVVTISDDSLTLIVSAPDGAASLPTTFDTASTTFDGAALEFIDPILESGAVYTYDLLLSATPSVTNPSKFVFGTQIFDRTLNEFDQFGAATSLNNGILLVGAPGDDLSDSTGSYGIVNRYNNLNNTPSWQKIYVQQPVVDIQLLNSVFTYTKDTKKITSYFDYIDPLAGKILGSVRQNLDFVVPRDPAQYNNGTINNDGKTWTDEHLGEVWWDLSSVRFIDYHQDTIEYKARRWGQLFPGSVVSVYQWVRSNVPPANYAGPGTVYSTTSYSVTSELDIDGVFRSVYYFWVRGLTTVDSLNGKTLSPLALEQYITNPISSGIPFVAPLTPSTIGLYNANSLIDATDTILHVEFDQNENDDNVHVEYDIITAGNSDSFIGDGLYRKMLDSFCGTDTLGNLVPDPTLSEANQQGVEYRPRQSFFIDRFSALENYIVRANSILARYPIIELRSLDLLQSEQPEPTSASGQWDKKVATYAELTYQNLAAAGVGYKYLVASDENNDGLWAIYTVQNDLSLLLTRLQDYDTNQYWSYVDWVASGYNLAIKPVAEVGTFSDLQLLTGITDGDSVKVGTNGEGNSEIYQYNNGTYTRVFAENATIEISAELYNYALGQFGFDVSVFDIQRLDQYPATETRQVLQALNQEIFIDDLAIHRNELLILVFEYVLSEQQAPEWIFKTSLIDVKHKLRDLLPYPVYIRDNQDFVEQYIKEVKPYHAQIREYSLLYEGNDLYQGDTTDFDCPAYYDTALQKFVSPQLGADDQLQNGLINISSVPATDPIWQTWPWSQWFDNYTLSLESVTLVSGGSGYTVEPVVTVTGNATVLPVLRARINTEGEVSEIEVISSGSGYTTTPLITITGGNGSGAIAVPIMENPNVRGITTTLSFDRYEYNSSVVDWQANTDYTEGTLVRFNNKVYSVNDVADSSELDSGSEFNPAFYTEVDQSTLSGVDRIIGLYQPTTSQPGRELDLVISGISYPGVQVYGPNFNQNTGFDVGNFDINPFDNLDFGPEGRPTYSEDILDAIYNSSFTDTYLGTRTTDINVDGSEFIDTYSSHAPEELVPGSEFDTLDLRVYTRPGADWSGDGHGFNIQAENYIATGSTLTTSFLNQMNHPVAVSVENLSTGVNLNAIQHFTVNWPARTVTVSAGISADDIVRVRTFGIGGGDQLLRQSYLGTEVGNSLTIDVDFDQINEIFVVVNGIETTEFSYAAGANDWQTVITFDSTYDSSHLLTVVALGNQTPQRSWSTPRGEYFIYDGSTLTFSVAESLQGTNPIDAVVFQDGKRLRPPETARYTGDGSSAGPYFLPQRGLINQQFVSDNDVVVYVNNERQFLSVDWVLSPYTGTDNRFVEFNIPPEANDVIKIAVTTEADYTIMDSTLTLRTNPAGDAIITLVTYNDTSEQGILTQVFRGPTEEGTVVQVPFDQIGFDDGDFDSTAGVLLTNNDLATGVAITNDSRIEVTKNGFRLTPSEGFTTTAGGIVTIGGSVLGPGDVVVITSFTMAVTPEEMNFRIFQDMLGNQRLLRIYKDNTTSLARALGTNDDMIYLTDVTKVSPSDIDENILGQIEIDGERITYRTRDVANNTVSGLRRGVAGTAIQSHAVGTEVTDVGPGEQLSNTYQKTTTTTKFTGDGTTKVFETTFSVDTVGVDSTELELAVRVKVGGSGPLDIREYELTQINPVEVTLVDAPANGVEVEVSKVTANVMYTQGSSTASNGIALQEQQTNAARFIRGEIL